MPSFWDTIEGQEGDPALESRRMQIIDRILAESSKPRKPPPQFPTYYTPERIAADTEQLRRGQSIGGVLQASGDQGLSVLGKTLAAGGTPQEYMKDAAQQEQVRRYQQWQADNADEGSNTVALARTLSALDSSAAGRDMPLGGLRDLEKGSYNLAGLGNTRSSFRPEYQQVLGKYTSVFKNVAPWTVQNGLEDVLADVVEQGATPEEVQRLRDSANWWAEFNRTWIAPGRHELFGATLTSGEQSAWNALVGITAATAPEEVQRRLDQLYQSKLDNERRRAKGFSSEYGQKTVKAYYGDMLDYSEDEAVGTDGTSVESALLGVDSSRRKPRPDGKVEVLGVPVRVIRDGGGSTVLPAAPDADLQRKQEVDGVPFTIKRAP